MHSQTGIHRPPRLRVNCLAAVMLLVAGSAHAASFASCQPGESTLLCRLESVLNVLYVLAALLAVLLSGAIWAAVVFYKKRQSDRSVTR